MVHYIIIRKNNWKSNYYHYIELDLFKLGPLIQLSESFSLQKSFQELLCKKNGDRALWEYPFAVAGVNITFMLIQMLDLQAGSSSNFSAFIIKLIWTVKLVWQSPLTMPIISTDVNVSAAKPTSLIGAVFLNLLLGKSFFYCYICVGVKSYRTDII